MGVSRVKTHIAVRNYYVLPCCFLMLNLVMEITTYKAKLIYDPFLRTAFIMAVGLFGGSLVAFAIAPGLTWIVQRLHQGSRENAGRLGELFFLLGLGALVFWLYYRVYILGVDSVLPAAWHNPV